MGRDGEGEGEGRGEGARGKHAVRSARQRAATSLAATKVSVDPLQRCGRLLVNLALFS